ncbi:MAG: lamin tail domain-containing protein [Planctomycetes bacterium]|nr:lamin tail domain-containing protein [Planctomycetota bacterium]
MRRSPAPLVLALVVSLLGTPRIALGDVVLSEIHYHPPGSDGRFAEFLEVHNPSGGAVDLGGWRLRGGVELTFPPGTLLPAGGYLAVARDAAALRERFGLTGTQVVGDYDGSLEDAGEALVLADARNAYVDSVTYSDDAPWPEDADGDGSSLQRICVTTPGMDVGNWRAASPTPGAPIAAPACPPGGPRPSLKVVINEVQYHPIPAVGHPATSDGEDQELIELLNPGAAEVDLGGWKLTEGVKATFPAGTRLPPGGLLVIGRDSEKLRAIYQISNVALVSFDGRLSNSGERITLADASGTIVDSLLYGQEGDWPYGPDGLGRSLERVVATGPTDDPANWQGSRILGTSFQRLVGDGPAGQGIGQKLLLSIDGPGEILVDNVRLEDVTAEPKLVLEETFDAGLNEWMPTGTLAGSTHAPGEGVAGTGALRLVSAGFCPNGECGSANSVSKGLTGLNRQGRFRVSLEFRYVKGSPLLRAGLARGAAVSIDRIASPGAPNTSAAAELPPFISDVRRFPIKPRPTDATWITARVRARSAPEVTLSYRIGSAGPEATVLMLDDGLHGDHEAGDGVFGVQLPPFPHDTQVRFRIRAAAGGVLAEHPRPLNPGVPFPHETDGYYVDALQPETDLPVRHLLLEGIQGNDPITVNEYLGDECNITRPASFVADGDLYPDVKVRFRGNTACRVYKRNFKVTFNRGRLFKGLRKLNLNSEWTDKALVREHLAWDLFRELGAPHSETRFTRLHLNGGYFGLYLYVEHPDGRFLERNGLDSAGNLYKAKQPPLSDGDPKGVAKKESIEEYMAYWEEETNEGGDFTDIAQFIDAMHLDGRRAGGPTSAFWEGRSIQEMLIAFQVGQVVLNNIDSFAKNHFLYHDLKEDRWGFITWDLDLSFGKFFFIPAIGPGREVGTLNDLMLSDLGWDLNPWFGATVLANDLYSWIIDFFFRAGNGFYQRAYLIRLWDVLQEKYTNPAYDPRLDDLHAFLEEEQEEDYRRWGRYPSNVAGYPDDMRANLDIMKEQIQKHREFLLLYFQTYHRSVIPHPRLRITEVLYAPENGDESLELLEILNLEDRPVDIGGWRIRGIGGKGSDFVFPGGSTAPVGKPFVVAKSPQAFRSRYPGLADVVVFGPYDGKLADEGEEIRLLDAGPNYPATIDYLRYDTEGAWPEARPGRSIELTDAAPDRDNDRPEVWVESSVLGGSPGSLGSAPAFVRSDANADGKTDLTDAVAILDHLFRGGKEPSCVDAADANDDGALSLTDAIFLLQHLFQGGKEPPAPYPDPGQDPTPDELGCA